MAKLTTRALLSHGSTMAWPTQTGALFTLSTWQFYSPWPPSRAPSSSALHQSMAGNWRIRHTCSSLSSLAFPSSSLSRPFAQIQVASAFVVRGCWRRTRRTARATLPISTFSFYRFYFSSRRLMLISTLFCAILISLSSLAVVAWSLFWYVGFTILICFIHFKCFTTTFIVTNIEPFREIALDSTDFPDYGEFRSFALGGILAIIVSLPDSSLMLGLLKVLRSSIQSLTFFSRKSAAKTIVFRTYWTMGRGSQHA